MALQRNRCLLGPEQTFCSEEEWFTSTGYVNYENNRYRYTKNPHAVHEVTLYNLEIRCVVQFNAQKIMWPNFFTKPYIPNIRQH